MQAEVDRLEEAAFAAPHPWWVQWSVPIAKFQYEHQDAISALVGLGAVGGAVWAKSEPS